MLVFMLAMVQAFGQSSGTLTILGVNTQVDSISYLVTGSDVEMLVDKYSAKLEASIISLAETLQQPAEFVYGIMVKQQYIKSVVWLLPWLLLIAFSILLTYHKSKATFKNGGTYHEIFTIASMLGIVIVFIVGLVNFQTVLQGFINPDYGAIQDIIVMFK